MIDASDKEILEVAKNLGMDVRTKTSAVFAGVTYPADGSRPIFRSGSATGTPTRREPAA
jgi:hypothetical protein